MKRLLPSDAFPNGNRLRSTLDGFGPSDQSSARNPDALAIDPELNNQQCALPMDPDPRRTAIYAIVTNERDGILFVQEAPIEIVPFRDTSLVHFAYLPSGSTGEELLVRVSESTCFDVAQPYLIPSPGTPIIVIGIDLGIALEAEIIAGMESEARYRSTVHRYQGSRDWHRSVNNRSQSAGS